jgi:hypothetical protein
MKTLSAEPIPGTHSQASEQEAETTSETTLNLSVSTPMGDRPAKPPVGSLSIPGKNGGRLRYGGTNRGGPGRPRDEVRAAALLSYDERIPALEAIADRQAVDYVPTKEGVVAIPPKCDTVIKAMAELRACAGMGPIPEKPRAPKQRKLIVRVVDESSPRTEAT